MGWNSDASGMDGGRVPNSIALRNVGYDLEGRTILHGIELCLVVNKLAVVGRNGSGKSTLARLLAGLVVPSRGTCHVNDIDVSADREGALAEIGIIFQNPDHQIIFPTVLEEISFGLRQQGRTKAQATEKARRALAAFGKSHWEDAPVQALSQGQKHLLCLIAIFALGPRMLILDEPFSGLDMPTKAQLARYLEVYRGSIVHITHEPTDIAGYDDMVWLEAGRVRLAGTPENVLPEYLTEMLRLGNADDIAHITC